MKRRLFFILAMAWLGGTALRAQETWSKVAAPTTQNLWSVCRGAGQFVAVGEGGVILTSADGAAWSLRDAGTTLWLVGVGHGNGLFVAVGDQGVILTSPDGITWTQRRSGGARLNAVAYGNGTYLAVDEAGGSWSSPDGLRWSYRATAQASALRGLVFAAPVFVVTGANGVIQSTFDGSVFSRTASGTTRFIESVAYGRRRYVATGADGAVLTSGDAINWFLEAPATGTLRGVGFFNNQFFGADSTGTVATSFDGSAWTPRPTGVNQILTAVAASDSAALAVGFGGTILRSLAAPNPPAVVTPPASLTEVAGNNVLLTVGAAGSAPLSYQWAFNGTPLAGETGSTLLLSSVSAASAGSYTVRVSNSLGTTTSAAAGLMVVSSAAARTPLIDPAFSVSPTPEPLPTVIAEQADGKILLGGSFTIISGSVSQRGLTRLQRDGARDLAFGIGSGANQGGVSAIALQTDGRILVSGNFTTFNGATRPGLARLNADGSLDTTFAPDPAVLPTVLRVVGAQPDGRVIVLTSGGTYRLRADGALETGNPIASHGRDVLAVLDAVGRIVVATTTQVLRLNPDGSTDATFTVHTLNTSGLPPRALRVLADGRIGVVSSAFSINGPFWNAARLSRDGVPDPGFNAYGGGGGIGISSTEANAAFTSDGRLYVTIGERLTGSGAKSVTRYLRDGINLRDPTFVSPDTNGDSTEFVHPLASGQSIAVGAFAGADGVRTPAVVRFQASNAQARIAPAIAAVVPETLTVSAGEPVAINVVLAGTGPFSASVNGAPATAVSGNTLTLGGANAQQSIGYTVTVTNSVGRANGHVAYVRVLPSAPVLTGQPQDATVFAAYGGGAAVFTVVARGTEPLSYQWTFNGAPVAGATTARLAVTASASTAGQYAVVVGNGLGQTTSRSARLTYDETTRIINLASRGFASSGEDALIVGFFVSGSTRKEFILRAAGPALEKFGVTGVLADPVLVLYDGAGAIVAQNDDWGTAFPPGQAAFDRVGAFRFEPGSRDAALSATLPPGQYTAVVATKGGASGVALAEIYDADTTAPRLVNLSSRLLVNAGEQVAIPGIVLAGATTKKLLIRGVGPTLRAFGVGNPLGDPALTVIGPGNVIVASNDNWGAAANAAEIAATAAAVGAFALPPASLDAAVLVTLPPGAYTAVVGGANGTRGTALVEVYEVP